MRLPINASTALNRMFCDSQPMVLKAMMKAMPVSPVSVTALVVAVRSALLLAPTSTSPVTLVCNVLLLTQALAEPCSTLVATVPLKASEVPSPKALPPDEVAVLSAMAVRVPRSRACTLTSPFSVVTAACSIQASTSPRTSLSTAMPPMATESDSVRLLPVGTSWVAWTSFHRSRSV